MSKTLIASVLVLAATLVQADRWEAADKATVRLEPRVFTRLPREIIRNLETRGCVIPQVFGENQPHNVIQGEFIRKGQTDWAVLCSHNRRSSILIFSSGSVDRVTTISTSPDRTYLQTIDGAGNIGFSRRIEAVGKDDLIKFHEEYGGPKLPPIDHQGINDAFVEKASVIHYYYRGEWLQLQGAD